jgi:hypothetical protein
MRRLSTLLLFGTALGAAALAPRLVGQSSYSGIRTHHDHTAHSEPHAQTAGHAQRASTHRAVTESHPEKRRSCHH